MTRRLDVVSQTLPSLAGSFSWPPSPNCFYLTAESAQCESSHSTSSSHRNRPGCRSRGYGTIDHIHIVRLIIQKSEEYNQPLCLAFVDYEKAFDSVETWAVLESLQQCQVDYRYIEVLRCLYDAATMSVQVQGQQSKSMQLRRGGRQGDVISPKLFTSALEDVLKTLDWKGQYRTKCLRCNTVVQKVRALLDEISDLRKNQVLGVCEHCKHANPMGNCRRCEYVVNKFLCNQVKQYEDRHSRFISWLGKVNLLLRFILERENISRLYKEPLTVKLEELLRELKEPFEMRQPDITFFPTEPDQLTQSKEMIDELLIKLKSENLGKRSSNDSLYVAPTLSRTCVCKYLMDKSDKKIKAPIESSPGGTLPAIEPKSTFGNSIEKSTTLSKGLSTDKKINYFPIGEKAKSNSSKYYNSLNKHLKKKKIATEATLTKGNLSADQKSNKKTAIENSPDKKSKTKVATRKITDDAFLLEMIKQMKEIEARKENPEKAQKVQKDKKLPKIDSLPLIKRQERIELVEDMSDSFIECGQKDMLPAQMIKGEKVVPFDPLYALPEPDKTHPIFFKTKIVFPDQTISAVNTVSTAKAERENKVMAVSDMEDIKGFIKYKLSDTRYIDKGWTILPTIKIMRRMNIYKMLPANPKNDWFKRLNNSEVMFYETGEKLAEIEQSGRGKWFYKNGKVALDYYNSQEEDFGLGQRYVVYSCGEKTELGMKTTVTVLACFDFLGNGIVYDQYGNERLKYNQTEGIVIDKKIGPSSRWLWHSLNEPPNLTPIFVNSHVKRTPCTNDLFQAHENDITDANVPGKESSKEMLAIEVENFVKEKAHKLLQSYRPFQIRMKAFKINNQFSLRILDQGNIYLLFRNDQVTLKLNLGLLLDFTEIIDTETAEMSNVSTPYDQHPPKSSSIAKIQGIVRNARRLGKTMKASSSNWHGTSM